MVSFTRTTTSLSSLPFPSVSLQSAFPFSAQRELEGGREGDWESQASLEEKLLDSQRARATAAELPASVGYNSVCVCVCVYESRNIVKSWIAREGQIRAQMRNRLKMDSN